MKPKVRTPHKKEYPMWVVHVPDVLKMTGCPRGHQQLMYDGLLKKWRPSMDCIIVSHQWLGVEHPDIQGHQLGVLQQALENMISGKVKVSSDIAYQFMGTFRVLSKVERKQMANAYVWLDWWSIPQANLRSFCWIDDETLERDQSAGIRSIPFYVSVSRFFISLVPPLRHEVTGKRCDFGTYLNRGWCRAEVWCRYLTTADVQDDQDEEELRSMAKRPLLPTIVVSAPDCIEFGPAETWRHCLAHEGEFSIESDRRAVGKICRDALDLKLQELSSSGRRDLDIYRVLLARREDLTGGEEKERTEQAFLSDFRFDSFDSAAKVRKGMGGLACATLCGDMPMMRRLVEAQASLTTRTLEMFEVGIGPEFAPLHLALLRSRHSTTALELLLELRSDPNMDAGASSCALGWCPTARAVEVMVQARADVNRVCGPPFKITPLQTAAMTHQRKEVFTMLLEKKADIHERGAGLRPPLISQLAVFCHLGYPDRLEVAELVVEAKADVNQKTEPRGMMYVLSLLARMRMRFPSPPLVVKVFACLDFAALGQAAIVGEACMVKFLLSARADPLAKSDHGVTQMDMSRSQEVRKAMENQLAGIDPWDDGQPPESEGSGMLLEMPF